MKRTSQLLRSAMKPGTVALKRTPFARAQRIETRESSKIGRSMKSKGPRMTPIRRAARGQDCQLAFPGTAFHDQATTVLCHSNFLADGKGMGLKAPDHAASFGCAYCHDVLDGRRPRPEGFSKLDMEGAFYLGVKRTHTILARMGLLNSEATTRCELDAASNQKITSGEMS